MLEQKKASAESPSISKEDFVEIGCVLCGSPEYGVLYDARLEAEDFTPYTFSARRVRKAMHYRIVKCKGCGLVRSSPVIREDLAASFYRQSRFIWPAEAVHAARTYSRLLESTVGPQSSSDSSIIEIGAADGAFLAEAKRLGFSRILGVEPSENCVENAPDAVKPFMRCDVFRPDDFAPRSFDAAVSFHVLDHVYDPLAMLEGCVRILKPGGSALFVCHDVEALSARILGRQSPIFDIEHVFLFGEDTARRLFEKAGFTNVTVGKLANTYPLEYWMRMAPGARSIRRLVPGALLRLPVTLKAGNLFIHAVAGGNK